MAERRGRRRLMNEINVVPYIDVMLVLLVIFMVTAPLIAPGEIELPSVGSKLTVPVDPLKVRLEGKSITLTDQATKSGPRRVTRDQLVQAALAAQSTRDQPVVIEADMNARYQDVLDVLDILQRNGVKKVGLLARPTPS